MMLPELKTTPESSADQGDNPDQIQYTVCEVPIPTVRLLFPRNYMSANINGDRVEITASVDALGIQELIDRLTLLAALLARGDFPQTATPAARLKGNL